jgi:D-methionine transport system ATP-binding protein
MVGGFASSYEAKSASTSEAPSPSHSEQAVCAFRYIHLQRLESPAISLSRSKQKALLGRELEVTWILNEPLVLLIFKKTKTGSCKMELALL